MRTIPEAARALGIPKASIARWINLGYVPAARRYPGEPTMLDEPALAQVRAAAALTACLGDGGATEPVIQEAMKLAGNKLTLDTRALTVEIEVPLQ